jgi:Tol biopolymer transport system component
MRLFGRLAVLTVTLLGLLGGQAFAAGPRWISFEDTRGDGRGVFVMLLDGSRRKNVSGNLPEFANGYGSDWSSGGSRLAFSAGVDGSIFVVRRDGSHLRRLTFESPLGDREPDWSPDGDQIAFQRGNFESDDICTVEVGTRRRHRLTSGGGSGGIYLDAINVLYTGGGQLFYAHENGGSLRLQVTHGAEGGSVVAHDVYRNWIVYVQHGSDKHWQLRVIRKDGSAYRVLASGSGVDPDPEWSPDGRKIVFVRGRKGNADIFTIRRDGMHEHRLTRALGDDVDPAWSPSGPKILFTSRRDGNKNIYVMRADGSHERALVKGPGAQEAPAWGPVS